MTRNSLLPALTAGLLCSAIPAHAQQPKQLDFPDGPGKAVFMKSCGGCHDANRARAGYTPEGWRTVLQMKANFDAPIAKDDYAALLQYLIKSFPERQRPAAKLIDGPVQVTIRQFPILRLGSRPHDPLATRDGYIWYTGQLSNQLGRVDPNTGVAKEYPLKTPRTGPHGLIEGKDGNIWFTGNHAALIGRLDPKTGNVTEYKVPEPVRDPHSLSMAPDGVVWFTAQQSNAVGRVDPRTGEVKVMQVPTQRGRPYGILVNAKGVPVFCLFGTNKLATIDPQTMAIKEYTLPDPAARARRIALTDENTVWYSDFARGYLGRYNLATGEHKEWQSPSGPQSQPYGIVYAKGAIWYNESFAKPNTIVRFDPQTEKFQTWPIPGGGDIVRKMDVTTDGNPVTANSLVNQVGLVEVR